MDRDLRWPSCTRPGAGAANAVSTTKRLVMVSRLDPDGREPRRRPLGADMSKNVRRGIKTRRCHAGCQNRPLIVDKYKQSRGKSQLFLTRRNTEQRKRGGLAANDHKGARKRDNTAGEPLNTRTTRKKTGLTAENAKNAERGGEFGIARQGPNRCPDLTLPLGVKYQVRFWLAAQRGCGQGVLGGAFAPVNHDELEMDCQRTANVQLDVSRQVARGKAQKCQL